MRFRILRKFPSLNNRAVRQFGLPVLSLHVEPEPCKQEHVGHEDDGVGPPGAVEAVV